MSKLTDKEKAFANIEYIKDFNGAKAAIRAGYSERSAKEIASRLLTKDNVKKIILKHFEKQGNVTQKILSECFKIATSDITDFVEIDDLTGAIKIKPLKDIPEGMTSVIKKIKEKRVIKDNADGTSVTVYDNIEYELYGKEKILTNFLNVAKLMNDKLDVNLRGNIGIESGLEGKLQELFDKYGESKIDDLFKLLDK